MDFPDDNFSVRWDTCLRVDDPTNITFQLGSDNTSRLRVDGETVLDVDHSGGFSQKTGHVSLTPGIHYVELRYQESSPLARVTLVADGGHLSPERLIHPFADPTRPCEQPADDEIGR
jgi:hypothetical protein